MPAEKKKKKKNILPLLVKSDSLHGVKYVFYISRFFPWYFTVTLW